jgi:hypothetical protein
MDAGPGINFLSVNKERLLFSTLGALSVPEAVETEILRKQPRISDSPQQNASGRGFRSTSWKSSRTM